ncbi:hypothetical protein EIP91_008705 [Steccherinum ochraceum]|uniref:Methyltransferase type 12 domain-containing protein n=1 Tax=Steccherinum ochraceum TaxID=92696 RepID=A0A4R0R4S1_9APHY|nr:hypothetical protein EIP91_008705 [Steccherinum ochraceum]
MSSSSQPESKAIHPSAAWGASMVLPFYDWWVLSISNSYAWCCPTSTVLLPLYQKYIGAHAHMEIGVGSGYYPASSLRQLREVERLALVDLHPNALTYVEERMKKVGYAGQIDKVEQDIFKPYPSTLHGQFDSVAMFYVFHCLPGVLPTKADQVFTQLKPVLKKDGVVYGATIMGHAEQKMIVPHNWFGRTLMRFYNRKGAFGNVEDTYAGLEESLKKHFEEVVELKVVGKVALFVARTPIVESA